MPESALPTTVSFVNLADSVRSSGLVSDDDMLALLALANGDPQELAKLLVERRLLTAFQVTALSEGRGAALQVGNYDIIDRLGAGGMGTVFKARHRRMKRIVALKVLAANLSKNPVFVKRFQREVETIAALGHPNVVMAYDADEADVGHFLVMEFVNGLDLAACVQRAGPFPLGRAIDCILQAARGLAYAHAQAIVHRDVKPHNLLLDENGVVKVTDLGLARLNHGADGPAAGADVTMAGGVIGTADYMPPEQAIDSTTIDHRADIYSLACTLYYLLAGKAPYGAPTLVSILMKHRDAPIPLLAEARPEVPPQLDDLFRRMMAKEPDERVQHMSDVVTELAAIATRFPPEHFGHEAETARPPESSGVGTWPAATNSTSALPDSTVALTPGVTSLTVLVVEPSRVQASIIKNFLHEKFMAVVGSVTTGREAIEAVGSLRPRAVVSAMYLSDMNGLELADQIRTQAKLNAPGFVLISSESHEDDTDAFGKLNRVLLLRKPFTSTQLVGALDHVTGASVPLPPLAAAVGLNPRTTPTIDRGQMRVLIADDSGTARINVRTVLQGLGFKQFLEVPDGAHAIAVAARETCHLIVTDYNMPLMDGRALVSYLKQNPATAAIPILMVTTETRPEVLDPVRQLGVVAVVEKAFPASVVGPLLDSLFG